MNCPFSVINTELNILQPFKTMTATLKKSKNKKGTSFLKFTAFFCNKKVKNISCLFVLLHVLLYKSNK